MSQNLLLFRTSTSTLLIIESFVYNGFCLSNVILFWKKFILHLLDLPSSPYLFSAFDSFPLYSFSYPESISDTSESLKSSASSKYITSFSFIFSLFGHVILYYSWLFKASTTLVLLSGISLSSAKLHPNIPKPWNSLILYMLVSLRGCWIVFLACFSAY